MTTPRFTVLYRVRSEAAAIEARAQAIAIEQSVEMPLAAITDPDILRDVVGVVEAIEDRGGGLFDVRIGLATATTGTEAGQLLNMAFGNTSLHEDVVLLDVAIPAEIAQALGGPRHGIEGLRKRAGATGRALTCSALKPQGLSSSRLAELARQFAGGGIDFIKDDHGLADQAYSPFAERVAAIAEVLGGTGYVPSLSGDLDAMRRQIEVARAHGIDTVMLAPMIAGWATMQTLVRQYPDIAFVAHPTLGGAARIAPDLLIGKLFRLLGADAVIFPNHGGRFGYSATTCLRLADLARRDWDGIRPSMPAPAGGMTLERVPELLDFYGPDAMLLIGGSLLAARERLTEETAAFTRMVAQHRYRVMPMDAEQQSHLRGFRDYRWDEVACLPYKEDGAAPFKAISRQVLFAEKQLGCELRYFEMAAGGYSTLERHEHMHAVMILRGHGRCLVGEEVRAVKPFDLVTIPSWAWHQFRATEGEPLGFLCMVNALRDRPLLPNEQELAALKAHPAIGAFLA